MGFSNEWEDAYKAGTNNSIWPWSDVVSMVNHYFKGDKGNLKVLELGCGAGANIPFFEKLGSQYFGVEGSGSEVKKLSERFKSQRIHIKCGDFTKEIPFEEEFDLILDRSSVTHNKTEDIKRVVKLVYEKLKCGGYYFGIDWFSTNYGYYNTLKDNFAEVDPNTRIFETGRFSGLGNVHFSDAGHIQDLFSCMEIVEIYEKIDKWVLPEDKIHSHWNFVARKV